MSNYILLFPLNETLHMSLAFVGVLDDRKLVLLLKDVEKTIKPLLPFDIKLDAKDVFGPKENPVPVRRCHLIDDKKNQVINEFYLRWVYRNPSMTIDDSKGPALHISIKTTEAEDLLNNIVSNEITLRKICIRRLGQTGWEEEL